MSKFCQNCGSALTDGDQFCASCGFPVAPSAEPKPETQQPSYQQQQPVFQQPHSSQFAQTANPAAKKKGKGTLVAVIAVLLAAAIGAVCFLGFRDGGFFRRGEAAKEEKSAAEVNGSEDNETTEHALYDAEALGSLFDYAKQLEEAGNNDAAAAIYEIIVKNGGSALIEQARDDIPLLNAAKEIDEIVEAFGRKGDEAE